jgi:hypothetical protein
MHVTIELTERTAAALEEQARAADVPRETFLTRIVDQTLQAGTRKPRKSAYGLLERYGSGPTEAEIDENRREMFGGSGESATCQSSELESA